MQWGLWQDPVDWWQAEKAAENGHHCEQKEVVVVRGGPLDVEILLLRKLAAHAAQNKNTVVRRNRNGEKSNTSSNSPVVKVEENADDKSWYRGSHDLGRPHRCHLPHHINTRIEPHALLQWH